MKWYALYTKPRWEKKVAKALEEEGIETYCPQVAEVRQWSDRKKKVSTPLFKSYVFVRIEEKDRARVFEVPGVVQYLFWLGKPAVVKDEEINIIRSWLKDEAIEDIEVSHLTPGDRLTISNGSFKGKEAEIQEIGNKRLKLILSGLGVIVNVKVSEVLK
ncbi:UpxY family transcription antiterminator [Salinimicrobium tongyeongense]|uniref:UpxY family transcription antiterminator n=1 Tax=Salinimicrobium tongyeongense TaxID=2809707 RepID=A0ABY6NQ38_9FLAO|nr:UpxY family transcription antiterminator [Salinimicrobium tongyeongense]UZH54658.1 UpxY family transcription antiterminator [Salinimicrobium tongyeongense]